MAVITIPKCKEAEKKLIELYKVKAEEATEIIIKMNRKDQGESLDRFLNGDTSVCTEYIKPEVLPATPEGEELPEGLADNIMAIIEGFCNKYGIQSPDKMGTKWGACCMDIGQYMKRNKILHDIERERHHGGTVYDVKKVEASIYIWAYFCNLVNCAPIIGDFVNFAGLSPNYFYANSSNNLTSSDADLLGKVKRVQEEGLQRGLLNSNRTPVGFIFALKSMYGYREATEVIHTKREERRSTDEIATSMGLMLEDSENTEFSSN